MDIRVEDKMVRQIEKNLSNNLSDNLFYTGNNYEQVDKIKPITDRKTASVIPAETLSETQNPVISFDYSNPLSISRAEYIRQARESCLRKLSEVQNTARAYDSYYMDTMQQSPEQLSLNAEGNKLLIQKSGIESTQESNEIYELTAFRLLIFRIAFAIIIFLGIFLIDKFNIHIGNITADYIQEYVTGKDTFDDLENVIVTWLKE